MTQTLGPWLQYSSAIVASILPEHLGTAPGREQFGSGNMGATEPTVRGDHERAAPWEGAQI